jgi:hypothetical protein
MSNGPDSSDIGFVEKGTARSPRAIHLPGSLPPIRFVAGPRLMLDASSSLKGEGGRNEPLSVHSGGEVVFFNIPKPGPGERVRLEICRRAGPAEPAWATEMGEREWVENLSVNLSGPKLSCPGSFVWSSSIASFVCPREVRESFSGVFVSRTPVGEKDPSGPP